MHDSAPPVDDGNVVGNVYDKYGTRNPVARWLVQRFLAEVTDLYASVGAATVLEVGCGEGRLAHHLVTSAPRPQRFVACDVDVGAIAPGLDPLVEVETASIYELPWDDDSFDLVVCCEVLEHLERPAAGVAELARVARRHVLLSTPWEPVWRVMNMARGKYWRALGNTPGHIQHFTRRGLRSLAETRLRVSAARTPLPWTVLLGEPRRT